MTITSRLSKLVTKASIAIGRQSTKLGSKLRAPLANTNLNPVDSFAKTAGAAKPKAISTDIAGSKTSDKRSLFGLFKKKEYEKLEVGQSVKETIHRDNLYAKDKTYNSKLVQISHDLREKDLNLANAKFTAKGKKFEKPRCFSYELSSDGTRLSKRAHKHNIKLAKSIRRQEHLNFMTDVEQSALQARADAGELIYGYNAQTTW